ncbi:MAG: inner membrane CreD family protein, partial [Bdellovibrionota bacterium]
MAKKMNPLVLKLLVLFVLLLVSSIPRGYVDWIISDRQDYERKAIESVVSGWAARHSMGRITLALPYTYRTEYLDDKGKKQFTTYNETFSVDPVTEKIAVSDVIDYRKRGIFNVPIYKADLLIEGDFVVPKDLAPKVKNEEWVEPDQTMTFATPHTNAISEFTFELDGKKLPLKRANEGFVLSFKEGGGLKAGQKVHYKLQAKLNGYQGIEFAGVADEFEVSIVSAWPHPSFRGQLPMEQEIRKDGFSAKWKLIQPSATQLISIDYIEPVNVYSQGARALKYGFLITLLCLSV